MTFIKRKVSLWIVCMERSILVSDFLNIKSFTTDYTKVRENMGIWKQIAVIAIDDYI